ncbi:MAG: M28 family peptidase [Bryobacterales bacterium]|nr:M28 family peptidase [Bryobacterales bacterium]
MVATTLLPAQPISSERLRAHVQFLASDLLEGRGTGQRGGEIATEYLASQLAVAGAKAAGEHGAYFQEVPLVGVQTRPESTLSARKDGVSVNFTWLTEFVGHAQTQKEHQTLEAEAIFVGHGITAPEFTWDDYAGTDVKGKVVVLFTNEPPSDDPLFFGGKALTYYGRWTYKYEEALRRGARAAIILHTNETAGYGWDVVRNSWGQEDAAVKVTGDALAFAGWLSEEAAGKFLAPSGYTVPDLLTRANTKGFRPIPLHARFSGDFNATVRDMKVRNVLGLIPGSDPALASEVVLYTAHWDHLGKGEHIFNGAVDNASGCAVLLEIARTWSELSIRPRRSALFLFTAAEEAGLRGAEFFAEHPTLPLNKIALGLNFDSYFPFGRTKDVTMNGAERTTFWPEIQAIARRFNLTITPDPRPEQGSFYRSDHFPLAKAGIAAFSVNGGKEFLTDSERKAALLNEYHEKHYHQPTDDYLDTWDFSGMEQIAQLGVALGQDAANADTRVRWADTAEAGKPKPAATKPAQRKTAPRKKR